MSDQAIIIKREHAVLGISCPICGSVFAVRALHPKYLNDNDHEDNARQVRELTEYALQGMNVAFYKQAEYKLEHCDHVKNRER